MADLIVGSRNSPPEIVERKKRNPLMVITLIGIIIYLLLMQFGSSFGLSLNPSLTNALGMRSGTIQGPEGPIGPMGPEGLSGISGADGINGIDGRDGADGAQGADGANGRDGANGAQGADGAQGLQGPPGSSMMQNGTGLIALGACDSSVIVSLSSEYRPVERVFLVKDIVLSDIGVDCQGSTMDIWIYGGGNILASGSKLIPLATTMTIVPSDLTIANAANTPVSGRVVAADPTGTYPEASDLVFTIQ